MTKLGKYLLEKNIRVYLLALLFSLFPWPGNFLAAILVGLVTLHKGWKNGLAVVAWVALPAVGALVFQRLSLFDILLVRCVLVWAFAVLLLRAKSLSYITQLLAVAGVVVVTICHLVVPDMPATWMSLFDQYIKNQDFAATLKLSPGELTQYLQRFSHVATGAVVFISLLGVIIPLFLARWWQSAISGAGLFRQEFGLLRMTRMASGIMLIATVGLYWQIDWLRDIYPVLVFPFFFAGLSLTHVLARKYKHLFFMLIVVYLLLVMLTYLMVSLLAIIGFIDCWYAFRERHTLLEKSY
jgi:hypothetical protein